MSTFVPYAQILIILSLLCALILRKRTGRWKRPWSFPLAMTLLGLALVMVSLATVLRHFNM
jgi:amino acid transporter